MNNATGNLDFTRKLGSKKNGGSKPQERIQLSSKSEFLFKVTFFRAGWIFGENFGGKSFGDFFGGKKLGDKVGI